MKQVFHLHVVSKDGSVVDAKHFTPDTLLAAAGIGHAFQVQDGCAVTITDKSEIPHKKYRIDTKGKPILI